MPKTRVLPCGCHRDGSFICEAHQPREASTLLSFLAIAAIIFMIACVAP